MTADKPRAKRSARTSGRRAARPTWLDTFRVNLLAPPLSEEEATQVAVEEVRAMRRERRGQS